MAREWYVDANRQPVNLSTVRGGNGKATATVYRLVEQPGGALLRSQWARSGADLSTYEVSQAQAAVSTDPLPTETVPESSLGPPTVPVDPSALTVGEATMPRSQISATNVALPAASSVRLTYFTARKSRACTQLRVLTGTTAAGATPTLCKLGLYSVAADGALTRVAATASDTTLFAAASTTYTRATTAPFAVTAAQRYAFGIIMVTAAALPTFLGYSSSAAAAAEFAVDPRISGALNTQTDLPATATAASVAATVAVFYGVVL